MEDEKIVDDIPTETMESDDDFFNDVDDEILSEEETSEEETSSEEETNEDSEPSETQEDNSDDEKVDFKPLLEELSKKVKYNKENVTIESLEDLSRRYENAIHDYYGLARIEVHKDECEAVKIGIDSLKTDEAYNLMYEKVDFIEIPDGATNGKVFERGIRTKCAILLL